MSFLDNDAYINEFNANSQRQNNKSKNLNYLINKVRIPKAFQKKKVNSYKKDKLNFDSQNKLIERDVTNNNSKNENISSNISIKKNKKEEEKNHSNKYKNIKYRPKNIKLLLKTKENFYIRANNKTYTHKLLNCNTERKIGNVNINEYKNRNFKRLNTLNLNNNFFSLKQVSRSFNKKQILSKIKDLLEEIEKSKDSKDNKNKKSKKLKDVSYLFLERSVKPQIPNLKNRIQLNKYLINDFKETESYQEYIKRSLKYKKINENYETAQMLKKETNQFYVLNEIIPPESDSEKEKEKKKNINKKKRKSSLLTDKTVKPKKKITFSFLSPNTQHTTFTLKNKNIEDNSQKNIGTKTESNNITPIIKNYKNKIYDFYRRNTIINNNLNFHFVKEEKNKTNNNNESFLEDELLTERPKKTLKKRNTEVFSSEKAILIRTKSNFPIKHKKYNHTNKKRKIIFDKFILSNNLYNEQKKYFDNYLMNKRITRSKNFSEQMSNLAKEKDLYTNNCDETGKLPRLKEGSLIYEMKLKNLFKNSFNPMANFKEGDDDLDLDNLKKIKNSVMEMEIEMFTCLKNEINPKYIKNKFNKITVGKYHSTRGVYFGSK